jgi:hypothetical protein
MKWYNHSAKQFGSFAYLNIDLPHDVAILPRGIYQKEMKTYVQTRAPHK